MYCPNCGSKIPNDSLICPSCAYDMTAKGAQKATDENIPSSFRNNHTRKHAAQDYQYNYSTYEPIDETSEEKAKTKKSVAVIFLIIAILFAACSAFALLTGFGVIDNYFGLFEATTESTVAETTEATTHETTTDETFSSDITEIVAGTEGIVSV